MKQREKSNLADPLDAERMWPLSEVAQFLGVSRPQAYKLVSDGVFPNASRISPRCIRVPTSDLRLVLRKTRIQG